MAAAPPTHTWGMRHRLLMRLIRLLTIFALLLGVQATASMSIAASDTTSTSMSMPAGSPCKDCGRGAMQATDCIAICIFVLLASPAPAFTIDVVSPKLRPALAAIPAGWSAPPETAPPRA